MGLGGDDKGMELARGIIRTFLQSLWRRCLTRESCSWLRRLESGVAGIEREQ